MILVDTSVSMKEPGLDPERSSLLVAKLLADIVPGHLAVIRNLDIMADKNLLPHTTTQEKGACDDNAKGNCTRVIPTGDWQKMARDGKYGALERPSRGDAAYKRQLDSHLAQKANNSRFSLGFRAAEGIFAEHLSRDPGAREHTRMIVWLSDGGGKGINNTEKVVAQLKGEGIVIVPVVFGKGDMAPALKMGLAPRKVSTPHQMMKAFANLFRRMVRAPYKLDNTIAASNTFKMNAHVEEAWVVVYGDASLGQVTLSGPGGESVAADHARDRLASAGGYKVAHLTRPATGSWRINVTGGGGKVAYAVVQRSELVPKLLSPDSTMANVPVPLVAAIQAGRTGAIVTVPDLLAGFTYTATAEGRTVVLKDDGVAPDRAAGDGRFSGMFTFNISGKAPVRLHAKNKMVDRQLTAHVLVKGSFRYDGGPIKLDLGTLTEDATACKPLVFTAKQQGSVPFEVVQLRTPPGDHSLEIRAGSNKLVHEGKPVSLAPGAALQVCLITSPRAGSSSASGEPWLKLRVAGSDKPHHAVEIQLTWKVNGLAWWERWLWLIITILALLVLAFFIGGYLYPARFPRGLALLITQDHDDLDDLSPQSIQHHKGVGIGFYRHARAYISSSYRVTGKPAGAVAQLQATRGGLMVIPVGGMLYRENAEEDWDEVPQTGRKARSREIYRASSDGPFFKVVFNRGR